MPAAGESDTQIATIRIKNNQIPKIAARLRPAVADIINDAVLSTAAAADPITPVRLGHLRANKSFQYASGRDLSARITWNQDYAAYQELGTYRIAPRRFAGRAVDAIWPNYVAALADIGVRLE